MAPTTAAIDVQDDKQVIIVAEDNEVAFTEDEIADLFQDTSSEYELGNKLLKENLQALREEPSSFQEAAMLCIFKFVILANVNFLVKILGMAQA